MSLLKTSRINVVTISLLLLGLFVNNVSADEEISIVQSPHDDRLYRGLTLDNGLRVLLVSDPDAEKAAVALNVEVGSYNDPKEREGLAHFLEHMLFLGTSKYPNPNEYSKFISEHGGMDNAWTSARNTQYYYTILPQYLPESLDRFAQFFIAPLFNEELVDRERHAVDSEYNLSLKKDGWRINEVTDVTANPEHPMVQFSIGDIETLGDKDKQRSVRDELIQFYNNYYTAERMVLAIVAPQSLNDLEKLAKQNFSNIVKKEVRDNKIKALAYTKNELGKKISIQTIGDYQELAMEFPIPSQRDHYDYKSIEYILYLLQQTGSDSLYHLLKSKDWISSMSASTDDLTTNQDTMDVSFSLTPLGLKNIDNIVQYTFDYIAFMRQVGPQENIFDELRSAGERNFTYADKQDPLDYVSVLPTAMQHYPLKKVLRASAFTTDSQFKPDHIQDLFKYLTPENMRLLVINPKIIGDKYEKHYQVKYKVENINAATLKKWSTPGNLDAFKLPPANKFLPEDFKLRAASNININDDVPAKIVEQPGVKAWFKQSKRFKVPMVNIMLQLQAPDINSTARREVLARFMMASLDDRLSTLASQAALAGVTESDAITEQGMHISISMFSDKMQAVMSELLHHVLENKIDPQRFKSYKDDIKRDLLNFKQIHPFKQAWEILSVIIKQPSWLPNDLLREVDNIKIEEVNAYIEEFLSKIQLQILINGNLTAQEAKDLISNITKDIQIDTKRASNTALPKLIKIPDATAMYYQFDPKHHDGVIVSYHQCIKLGDAAVATNLLLIDIMDKPVFEQLRTIEQLGYVVGINPLRVREQTGAVLYIESSKKQPAFLQQRIDNFLEDFQLKLAAMPEDEFNTYKSSLESVLLQKPNSIAEETARYWSKIVDQSYRFNYEKDIAAAVKKLQLKDVNELFASMWIDPKLQRSISVISIEKGASVKDMKPIKSIAEFKSKSSYN